MPTLTLHDELLSHSASFISQAEWEIPDHYGNPVAEHEAVRNRVGMADRSHRGKLLFRGSDRVEFLQGMVTNDVQTLTPGGGCYAVITTSKAKMLADCRLYGLDESILVDLEAEAVEKVKKHLDFYIIASDVTIEDLTEKWGMLSLFGPKSTDLLAQSLGISNPPSVEYHYTKTTVESIEIIVARNDITGEAGYDLFVPTEGLKPLFDRLIKTGTPLIGQKALHTLRVEAGIPQYGVDMDESHFPMEAGLTLRAISETKGCYLGQETIARALAQGHMNRHLVGLELTGDAIPEKGHTLQGGDRKIGTITSAVFSPTLKKIIAMGYVQRNFAKPGSEVSVLIGENPVPATVSSLPFYKRD